MFYRQTSINVKPGMMGKYFELEKKLNQLMAGTGFKLVGSWHKIVGDMHEVTRLYAFEDFGESDRAAAALVQDGEHLAVFAEWSQMVSSEITKLMSPTPETPLK